MKDHDDPKFSDDALTRDAHGEPDDPAYRTRGRLVDGYGGALTRFARKVLPREDG